MYNELVTADENDSIMEVLHLFVRKFYLRNYSMNFV
jgi:hypothetical protein